MTKAVDDAAARIEGKDYAAATADLADLTGHWTSKATKDYKALGDMLLVKFLDGNVKRQNSDGTFSRTPEGMPVSPEFGGYDDPRYFRQIVDEQGDRLKVIDTSAAGINPKSKVHKTAQSGH